MSKINNWRPDARTIYLKHPVSKRVLALNPPFASEQFIRELRHDAGYLSATAAEYQAQQDARRGQAWA